MMRPLPLLNVGHPVVFYNNVISSEESIKHNSNIILNTLIGGGYMFRPLRGHLQAIR
jgi:hypothetical protein